MKTDLFYFFFNKERLSFQISGKTDSIQLRPIFSKLIRIPGNDWLFHFATQQPSPFQIIIIIYLF